MPLPPTDVSDAGSGSSDTLLSPAASRALQIPELLEQILFCLSVDQLSPTRLVSRHWNQAALRPTWHCVRFTPDNASNLLQRDLAAHGHMVEVLDLSDWTAVDHLTIASRDKQLAGLVNDDLVQTLTQLCPRVNALRIPYHSREDDFIERLIHHYTTKKVNSINGNSSTTTSSIGGHDQVSQLSSLWLDLSQTPTLPAGKMSMLTDAGVGLRQLRLKLQLQEYRSDHLSDAGVQQSHRSCFFKFDTLLKECSKNLEDLEVVPAPGFLCMMDQQQQSAHSVPSNASNDTLHELQQALLNMHIMPTGSSNTDTVGEEESPAKLSTPYTLLDSRKQPLSFETVLKAWPWIRKLRLDGNRVRMLSEDKDALEAPRLSQPLLPVGSYHLSSLSLYNTIGLCDATLITLIDLIHPTLHLLNVDRNTALTDKSIRHVLMTCSHLRELSAAELDLTMALFEDHDFDDDETAFVDRDGHVGVGNGSSTSVRREGLEGLALKPWACSSTLENLDLSWRFVDGRAPHVPASMEAESFDSILQNWDRNLLPPHDYQRDHQPQEQTPGGTQDQLPSFNQERAWRPRVPVRKMQRNILPMFRKLWQKRSIYERLRVLEKLEVLQLEGWLIPWRSADVTAFLGYSDQDREEGFVLDRHFVSNFKGAAESTPTPAPSYDYREAEYVVVSSPMRTSISRVYQPPTTVRSNTLAHDQAQEDEDLSSGLFRRVPMSGLRRLRHLNIACEQAIFLDNPIGEESPFRRSVFKAPTGGDRQDDSMDNENDGLEDKIRERRQSAPVTANWTGTGKKTTSSHTGMLPNSTSIGPMRSRTSLQPWSRHEPNGAANLATNLHLFDPGYPLSPTTTSFNPGSIGPFDSSANDNHVRPTTVGVNQESFVFAVLGAFMKACPQLTTCVIRPTKDLKSSIPEVDENESEGHNLHEYPLQLASAPNHQLEQLIESSLQHQQKPEESSREVGQEQKRNKRKGLQMGPGAKQPAPTIVEELKSLRSVSSRKMFCTTRAYPEYSVIRTESTE
ncbi:hypothetical protein BGZ98_004181 [Dissophora globulifera]|nr:hypothetical protein BGZ98_004181 [Dissophora globulifera]